MGRMRPICTAATVVLAAATLAGCASPSGYTPAPKPPTTRESTGPSLSPEDRWAASPEFPVCVELYASIPGATDDADLTCRELVLTSTPSELSAQYGDPLQVDFTRETLLAIHDPIEPHYVLSFSGTGEAVVTWSTGAGMIQRAVQLPYSEEIPIPEYINSNVVQIPAQSGVGCAITAYSNDERDGLVLVDVPPATGQTMASCVPD